MIIIIISGVGERIKLDNNELEVLKLGPKFCLYVKLVDEDFETDLEESIMKIKWDLMGDDQKVDPGLEDVALEVLLGKDVFIFPKKLGHWSRNQPWKPYVSS